MNAQCNAPISDRFSSLCARVFYRRSAILKNRRGEGPGDEVVLLVLAQPRSQGPLSSRG